MASSVATDRSWRSTKLLLVASLSLHQRSPLSAVASSFLIMSSVSWNAKESACRAMSSLLALCSGGRHFWPAAARPSPLGLPMQGSWASRSMTSPVDALSMPLPFFFSTSCQRAKLSFHFFKVLDDSLTVSQCKGLAVVGRLEVLQRFQNLHSALTMASCISKKQ
jgi:hypothetical protein